MDRVYLSLAFLGVINLMVIARYLDDIHNELVKIRMAYVIDMGTSSEPKVKRG